MAHIPIRECIACGGKFPKGEMLRIAEHGGLISPDRSGKCGGRGAYVCKKESCMEIAIARKKLNRAFRKTVQQEVYLAIREELEQDIE